MIYFFTGQPGAGKTTISKKLHRFLKTDKRNWRKNVFHLDSEDLVELTKNKDFTKEGRRNNIKSASLIIEFLHNNDCDIVVSMIAPYRDLREELKDKFAEGDYQEIFVHTDAPRDRDHYKLYDYECPQINFIDIDTTKDSPDTSFSKLINHLNKLGKL
jgi:adenylylsulfate kinase-like enzyme